MSKTKLSCMAGLVIAAMSLGACVGDFQATDINKVSDKEGSQAQALLPQLDRSAADFNQQVEKQLDLLLAELTLDEKISLVHASGKFVVAGVERLGIKETWLSDGPHGVRYEIERHSWNSAGRNDDHATYLPHLTSVAASWDTNIAHLHGKVLGREARHRNKDYILGPGVNLARLPTYGRNFEYMGEDPYLAATLVVPQIKAIQKQGVAATIKHYALNTQELNRTGVNAKPDERTLREVYLPAFEAAVKEANVLGIMGAYNEYMGTNANQSRYLVRDILKDQWGFEGVLLTDWNVDINTFDAAMAGLDLEMGTDVPSYDEYFFAKPLKAQIEAGKVPMAVLDDKVKRLLRVQYRIGMYDDNRPTGERNTQLHQLTAKQIAAQGVVLLKNDEVEGKKVLPLNKQALRKVLVLGPNADKRHGFGGGSSEVKALYEVTPLEGLQNYLGDDVEIEYMRTKSAGLSPIAADYITSRHWTGTPAWHVRFFESEKKQTVKHESWNVASKYKTQSATYEHIEMTATVTPAMLGEHTLKLRSSGKVILSVDGQQLFEYQGGEDEYAYTLAINELKGYQFELQFDGKGELTLGWETPDELFVSQQQYLTAAKQADAVIYFGGLSHSDDREAIDRTDMTLPFAQDEIITKLLAVNPKTVVFMVAGSAVEMPWVAQANALVWGWYGGMEAGNAFAQVLFGEVNPSGKMPITLPVKYTDTAPIALDDYNATESLYKEGVFIGYRWFEQQKIKPMFAFGHGLSYSDFAYSNLQLSKSHISPNETLQISVEVTNNSKVAGKEVVQLYLHDINATVPRPLKELKGFSKVSLLPGQTKTVQLSLDKKDLSFWDVEKQGWLAQPGQFKVMIGSASDDIRLSGKFTLTGG